MNEALEQSAREGMSLGTRLFEVGGFVLSTGAAAPLTDAWMDALRDDLWTRRKPGSLSDAEVITLYRLTMALGLVDASRSASSPPRTFPSRHASSIRSSRPTGIRASTCTAF